MNIYKDSLIWLPKNINIRTVILERNKKKQLGQNKNKNHTVSFKTCFSHITFSATIKTFWCNEDRWQTTCGAYVNAKLLRKYKKTVQIPSKHQFLTELRKRKYYSFTIQTLLILATMSKLVLAFALVLLTIVTFGEGAVVIRRPSNSNETPAQGTRIVSVLPSDDKNPRKRNSPVMTKEEVLILPEGAKDRSTFSINKRRPCTFCKFFTTVAPAPKPKMYFKFVQPWTIGSRMVIEGVSVLLPEGNVNPELHLKLIS